ncbi:MAG: HEAT repeat domain-containing protein, partial [Verrucomicrobiales bacterium]
SKPYQLPERPWGTAADDAFPSLDAVPDASGEKQDLTGETLARDSSLHFIARFHRPERLGDDEIRRYIHHQDFNIRNIAAFKALGINFGYIGAKTGGGEPRPELVMEFLKHDDPRVRRVMFGALLFRSDMLTPEIFELAVRAVEDPEESWWIKDAAIQLIGRASTEQILPLVDLLIPYLEHEEAWLRNAALTALTPVAGDERCYQRVLPAMGELLRNNQRVSVTLGFAPAIRAKIKGAGPAVQKLATETLRETFTGYAGQKSSPAGQNLKPTYDYHLEAIAASLADVPGGMDVLYEIARDKHPEQILPYKEIFLAADPSTFGPKLTSAITPIITDELIPEFVGKNRKRLKLLAANEVKSGWPGGRGDPIDDLVALYERAGRDEFGWHMFADLRNAEWSYHSFDPIPSEQVPFDQLVSRYRDVTPPTGMENWFAEGFDGAAAGWKTGRSPFGNYMGKIPDRPITKCSKGCVGPGCYGATQINTLWENEVLLMRGTFKVPPLKDGHRYRLRVNSGEHVGAGGGHLIYINGRPLIEATQGGGRGSGGRPKGAYITREFIDDFNGGEITIAVKAFIRYNDKYSTKPKSKTPQGKISLHLDEQMLPPMGDELITRSATVVPMLSSDWQAKLDPEDAAQNPDDNLFRWDGEFASNPVVTGEWQLIGKVAQVDDFDPEKKTNPRNAPFTAITLGGGGRTSSPLFAWSGDILMDLDRYQALRMQVRNVGGEEYLFVESGDFNTRHKPGWRSQWFVLKRP